MNISHDDYLKAKGLHFLAKQHYDKSDEFRRALEIHLGREPDNSGHISDSVYADRDFDEALQLIGIIVDPPKRDAPHGR